MEQLTKKQAQEIGKSRVWETWSDEEIVKVQLFQDRHCVGLSKFSAALSAILGRPVLMHEIAYNRDGLQNEYLKKAPAPTLNEIINLIPKKRRILVWL